MSSVLFFSFLFCVVCVSFSGERDGKHAVVGQDSYAIGTWKDVYWSSRVLPLYHPRRRVRFCVVINDIMGKLNEVFIFFIDLVVFIAVG
jgi:hypothetical protein